MSAHIDTGQDHSERCSGLIRIDVPTLRSYSGPAVDEDDPLRPALADPDIERLVLLLKHELALLAQCEAPDLVRPKGSIAWSDIERIAYGVEGALPMEDCGGLLHP